MKGKVTHKDECKLECTVQLQDVANEQENKTDKCNLHCCELNDCTIVLWFSNSVDCTEDSQWLPTSQQLMNSLLEGIGTW